MGFYARLEKYCERKALSLLENMPAFVTSTRQEVEDIILGNTLINGVVWNWRVPEEPSMSDHEITIFDVKD